ncbi:MAG: rhodanese-like domain-containing protein [Myxococcota bacterium]|nr:rhodanese-like domain-containing protein [Myxococcota bacterium]
MFGKMINMPFKLLGGVARVVQANEAKKWTGLAERDATAALDNEGMDISVPDDFDPGSIVLPASEALLLRDTGCILDTAPNATIHGALHIPMKDIGIGIAEVPADVRVAVVAERPEDGHRIVRFLRHRGLDDTWVVDGGLAAWRAVDHPTHQE